MSIFGGKPDIEKLKSRRDIKGLVKALGYTNDVELHLEAIQALVDIGDEAAIEPLIQLLDVYYYFDKKKERIYQAAIDALLKFGERAVPLLTGEIKNETRTIRKECTDILDLMGWQPGKDEAGARYWIGKQDWQNCFLVGRAAVPPLIVALKYDWAPDRIEVAKTLGRLRDPRAITALKEAMHDRDQMVCHAAAQALSKIKDPQVVITHIRSLKDDDVRARLAASGALATQLEPGMLDEKSIKNLCAGLRDSEGGVRTNVAKALARLRHPASIPALLEALQDINAEVKKNAILALAEIGDPSVVKHLQEALSDGKVAQTAAEMLEKLNWQPQNNQLAARFYIARGQWDQFQVLGVSAEGLFTPPESVAKSGWRVDPKDAPTTYRRYEFNLFNASELLKSLQSVPREVYYKVDTIDGTLCLDINGFFTNAPLKDKIIHPNFFSYGGKQPEVECKSLTARGNDIANQQAVAWLKMQGEYANFVLLMECGFCGYQSPVETEAGEFVRRCYCCGAKNLCERGNILVFVNGIQVSI